MKVHIQNKQKAVKLSHERKKITDMIHFLLAQEKKSCDEVGIFFITDAAMRKLHKEFFNDPSSTDCMSFPIDDCTPADSCTTIYLGDIFVCPEEALKYPDPYSEITLYIMHGLLHLLGYDDIDPKDRKKMQARQRSYMKKLTQLGLILHA